jgi:A/G-specific adenine glycosylase
MRRTTKSKFNGSSGRVKQVQWLRRRLLNWGKLNFRDFVWRSDRDAYRLLVTEVLLRQTNAGHVLRVREAFLSAFPKATDLCRASPDEVFGLIRGLGFGRQRADQLRRLGCAIVARNRIPTTARALADLPGVGNYTAGAVACFAFGRREPAVDVNVARIIGRLFDIRPERGELRKNSTVRRIAMEMVAGGAPRRLNWALLDLGALICRPTPRCTVCPLLDGCLHGGRVVRTDRLGYGAQSGGRLVGVRPN